MKNIIFLTLSALFVTSFPIIAVEAVQEVVVPVEVEASDAEAQKEESLLARRCRGGRCGKTVLSCGRCGDKKPADTTA